MKIFIIAKQKRYINNKLIMLKNYYYLNKFASSYDLDSMLNTSTSFGAPRRSGLIGNLVNAITNAGSIYDNLKFRTKLEKDLFKQKLKANIDQKLNNISDKYNKTKDFLWKTEHDFGLPLSGQSLLFKQPKLKSVNQILKQLDVEQNTPEYEAELKKSNNLLKELKAKKLKEFNTYSQPILDNIKSQDKALRLSLDKTFSTPIYKDPTRSIKDRAINLFVNRNHIIPNFDKYLSYGGGAALGAGGLYALYKLLSKKKKDKSEQEDSSNAK